MPIGQAGAPYLLGRLLCGQRACLSRTLYRQKYNSMLVRRLSTCIIESLRLLSNHSRLVFLTATKKKSSGTITVKPLTTLIHQEKECHYADEKRMRGIRFDYVFSETSVYYDSLKYSIQICFKQLSVVYCIRLIST